MARNITVYDLDNYPDNSKTVTIDQQTIVPVGAEGDEKWVLSFTTTAYSDNTNNTPIQDLYIQELKTGWAKSSGLVSLGGYKTSATSKKLGVKIDNSNQYYYIELAEDLAGGDNIANALEEKIRAIPTVSGVWNSNDDALAYKNAIVKYINNKFYIVSGNMSDSYIGTKRSSVKVTASGTDTLYRDLGFDLGVDSESLASISIPETSLATDYTAGSQYLYVNSATGINVKDCCVVTDGTNTDYFQVIAISGTRLTVPTNATNGFDAISHSYTANRAKIQVLRYQDPDREPNGFYDTVDEITRFGIMSIVNQIDFSS